MQRPRHLLSSCPLLLLGATLAFCANVHAQSTMSPEELAVRTAYARITFAAEANAVDEIVFGGPKSAFPTTDPVLAATMLRDDLLHGQPHFTLTSMRIGNLSDIADRSLDELVTQNTGTILQVEQNNQSYTTDAHLYQQVGVRAAWRQQPSHGYSWHAIHIRDFTGKSEAAFMRYASYDVTVTLDSETRTSRALVLFKPNGEVLAIDTMLDWQLSDYFNAPVYPHIFLEVPMFRAQSFVNSWLASHEVSNVACKADQQHDCFDPVTGVIGIHPSDLEHSIINPPAAKVAPPSPEASPYMPYLQFGHGTRTNDQATQCSDYNSSAPNVPLSTGDTAQHLSGAHQMGGSTGGTCTYADAGSASTYCNVTASAFNNPTASDSGTTTPYLHQAHASSYPSTFTAFNGATATANATMGGSVLSCPLAICADLSSPLFSVKATVIWSPVLPNGISCAPKQNPANGGSGGYNPPPQQLNPDPCFWYDPNVPCDPGGTYIKPRLLAPVTKL